MRAARGMLKRQAVRTRGADCGAIKFAPNLAATGTPASASSHAPDPARRLPQVLVVTFVVAVCPLLVVTGLGAAGLLRSWGISIALCMALSLGASIAGNALWRRRPGSGDMLFAELMLWGWLRRLWIERQLTSALCLLEGVGATEALSIERRAELLTRLVAGLEGRDLYTHGHSRRVARTAAMIATRMGLHSLEVAKIRTAAILHDVGKINTPLSVLHKPGRLTDEEFDVIKQHPVDGATMVMGLGDPELTAMVRHHHERLDGTGYPDRLSGEAIPLGARIIAVADTFDAITSVRPYRGASAHKKAIDILAREAGAQLDPGAVRAFHSGYAGRRPLALWAVAANTLERLVWWLTGGLTAASSASVAPLIAAAALSGAIGAAAAPTHPQTMRSRQVKGAPHTSRSPGSPYGSDRQTGSVRSLAASAPGVGDGSPTHRGQREGNGAQNPGGSAGGATGGNGPGSGGGSSGSPGAAGGSNGSGTGSGTNGGASGPSGGGAGGQGGSGTGGSAGLRLGLGGTSVSTGHNGTTVSAGGTTVSTGHNGTTVSAGGTTVSTGHNGTTVSIGGTSVSTGHNLASR